MIKFIVEEKEIKEELTLEDVEEDQFFVNDEGRLCQKVSEDMYNTIADDKREPLACETICCDYDMPIMRVLPKVKRIEF